MAVPHFEHLGPPSSPPTKILLSVKITKQTAEVIRNMNTEKPSLPAGTFYSGAHKFTSDFSLPAQYLNLPFG